jgi:DNA-binding NarL/FixJ family response regulator
MAPLRVLVADDQEAFRRRVCLTLASHPNLEVCAQAANGQEAVEKALELTPDLIILDITMPVLNGLDAARQIHKSSPQTPILILSVHKSKQLVEEAMKIGARGYVTKAEAGQKLMEAVDSVLQNQTFFPTDL